MLKLMKRIMDLESICSGWCEKCEKNGHVVTNCEGLLAPWRKLGEREFFVFGSRRDRSEGMAESFQKNSISI